MQRGRFINTSWVRGCALLVEVLLACSVSRTLGYAFLHTPMGRGTVGYPNPINPFHWNNFCQVSSNIPSSIAQCGVCGDPLEGPRKHEVGGEYATGIVTGSYTAGATIPVKVHHANFMAEGWFEFRLCPVLNAKAEVTQQCLDQHLLKFADGKTRATPSFQYREITLKLKLPDNITCSHCVLQWKYYKEDHSEWCIDDFGDMYTCGEDIEYYNCADISISETSSMQATTFPKTDPVNKPMTKPLTQPVTTPSSKPVALSVTKAVTKPLTQPVKTTATKPVTQSAKNYVTLPTSVQSTVVKPSEKCIALGHWAKQPGILTWCAENCANGHCPADMCIC